MAMMPISDYPAPASDKAQAQVLTERKGELNQRLQTIQQSNLPRAEKESQTASVQDQIQDVGQQREHKLREAANKDKQRITDTRQEKQKQRTLEREDMQHAQTRHMLDVQA